MKALVQGLVERSCAEVVLPPASCGVDDRLTAESRGLLRVDEMGACKADELGGKLRLAQVLWEPVAECAQRRGGLGLGGEHELLRPAA